MAYSLYEWDKEYGTGGNLGWDYYYAVAFSGQFSVNPNGDIVAITDAPLVRDCIALHLCSAVLEYARKIGILQYYGFFVL